MSQVRARTWAAVAPVRSVHEFHAEFGELAPADEAAVFPAVLEAEVELVGERGGRGQDDLGAGAGDVADGAVHRAHAIVEEDLCALERPDARRVPPVRSYLFHCPRCHSSRVRDVAKGCHPTDIPMPLLFQRT